MGLFGQSTGFDADVGKQNDIKKYKKITTTQMSVFKFGKVN